MHFVKNLSINASSCGCKRILSQQLQILRSNAIFTFERHTQATMWRIYDTTPHGDASTERAIMESRPDDSENYKIQTESVAAIGDAIKWLLVVIIVSTKWTTIKMEKRSGAVLRSRSWKTRATMIHIRFVRWVVNGGWYKTLCFSVSKVP